MEEPLELACIPPEEIWKIWPGVCDFIDAGFAASDVPMPDDILSQLRYGTRLLWVVATPECKIVAAMLTQLFDMRNGKICKMMECGGSHMSAWKDMRSQIEQYAREEGCDRVLVEGRPGWARVFPDYRTTAVMLEKRI